MDTLSFIKNITVRQAEVIIKSGGPVNENEAKIILEAYFIIAKTNPKQALNMWLYTYGYKYNLTF